MLVLQFCASSQLNDSFAGVDTEHAHVPHKLNLALLCLTSIKQALVSWPFSMLLLQSDSFCSAHTSCVQHIGARAKLSTHTSEPAEVSQVQVESGPSSFLSCPEWI